MMRMQRYRYSRKFPLFDLGVDESAMYTLYIFDETRAVTAIPQAGYLGSYLGFAFGLYQPQPYTPLPSKPSSSSWY